MNVSEPTALFLTMLVVAAFYGLLAWRFLVVPLQRRQTTLARVHEQRRPLAVVRPIERVRSAPVPAGRHLVLVPKLPD